jgi:hypothetical protein
MKTTSSLVGTALVTLACTYGLFGVGGCNNGLEGLRCNPDLTHDPCNSGLTCFQPLNCPENYCCPASGPPFPPGTSEYCLTGCAGGDLSICTSGGTLSEDSGMECDGGAVVPIPDGGSD